MDPEPGMVEAARAAAERAGVTVRFIAGRLEDASAALSPFDVVSIGRAIHWLDPAPAQAALESALATRGRVLVCGATSVRDGRNPWLETFKQCEIAGKAIVSRSIRYTFRQWPVHQDRSNPGRGDVRRSR